MHTHTHTHSHSDTYTHLCACMHRCMHTKFDVWQDTSYRFITVWQKLMLVSSLFTRQQNYDRNCQETIIQLHRKVYTRLQLCMLKLARSSIRVGCHGKQINICTHSVLLCQTFCLKCIAVQKTTLYNTQRKNTDLSTVVIMEDWLYQRCLFSRILLYSRWVTALNLRILS